MNRSIRLLIVDDEPVIVNILVSYFDDPRFVVDSATIIDEAINLIENKVYDVAIVDKNMRGILTSFDGGIEIMSAIREKIPKCRTLAITGCPDESSAAEIMRTGASGCLAKPFSMSEIVRRVDELAGGSRTEHSRNRGGPAVGFGR